jgi:hypothetical protein
LPYAFTEQGIAMLSSVLHSPRAIAVNIEIMRAFVRLREILASHADLAKRLSALESKYDRQFAVVFDAIRKLMAPPRQPIREMGYHTLIRKKKGMMQIAGYNMGREGFSPRKPLPTAVPRRQSSAGAQTMRTDYPQVDDPSLREFASLADTFCTLVDQHETLSADAFLLRVHPLLPALYSGGLALPSTDILFDEETDKEPDDETDEVELGVERSEIDPDRHTHDEWQRLFSTFTVKLGQPCNYREIVDPYDSKEQTEVTASLADDIADIYRDLRCGLLKWHRGETGNALWAWRFHFECHWGGHVTSSLKALWAWAAWHEGGWPERRPDDS